MRLRIFTFLVAFLAIAGNAVWGQETTEINISFMNSSYSGETPSGEGKGFTVSEGTDSGTGDDDQNNILTITSGGYYKLTGGNSNIQIKVTATEPVHITLGTGVHVDASLDNDLTNPLQDRTAGVWENRCAMEIAENATVTLDWEGDCELSSGGLRAGINVKPNATLILEGTHSGTLTATCWNNQDGVFTIGAGIGGDSENPNFGTIIIENGSVLARCYAQVSGWRAYGAGIGGGYNKENSTPSTSGTIIIKGGDVTATANYDNNELSIHTTGISAAIGGGYAGTCTNIAILGGTVNATTGTDGANEIGVGKDYGDGGVTNGIIIGQWAEDTTAPTVTGSDGNADINDVNYLYGPAKYPEAKGKVTMPDYTQIYVPNAPVIAISDNAFNAYNVKLLNSTLGDETHDISGTEETEKVQNYYFGAKQEFTVNDLSCNEHHLFLGWFENNTKIVASEDGSATFTMPSTTPTSITTDTYYPVWVDDEYSITVKTQTEWKKDGDITPQIAYTPAYTSNDVLSNLSFKMPSDLPNELTGLSFDGNQIIGTPTLHTDTYKKLEVTATVSLNEGTPKDIKLSITVVDENMINSIALATRDHIYNGQLHNGRSGNVGGDYLFDVLMTHDIAGQELPSSTSLTEGVHYRIYKYSFNGGNEQTASDGNESLPVKDAGTYSNITIQALDAVLTDDNYLPIADGTKNLGNDISITVSQRPMTISLSFNKTSIEEDEELTWDEDVAVEVEEMSDNRGLVEINGEKEDITVEGDINYILNDEGTSATVTISNVRIIDGTTFKQSNYEITVNGVEYTGEGSISIPETVPVISTPSTGGGTKQKYKLYLANKDYLETGETPIYYEKEGLELFSRHNKKYTTAGGSFTIWYEKDGVPNDGNYRIFWSKRANGEYKEVKFDDVSEYYQIRDVYSNVYVKIFYENGFPVANEEISATDARAYAQANKIVVITPEPTDVQIISMAGAVVATDQVTGQREFANLMEGIYIVRMGDTVVKLQVRN